MPRDSIERGEEMERIVLEQLKKCEKFRNVKKNEDPYDIDLVVEVEGRKILIEVEETAKRNWPSNEPKPLFISGFLTMPARKIKYFVDDGNSMESYLTKHRSIDSIEEFKKLYKGVQCFKPIRRDKEVRIYLKGSHKMEHICIVRQEIIVNALNGTLIDQKFVEKRKNELTNGHWQFEKNLWENNSVTNMKNEPRDDKLLLILGLFDREDNGLIWGKLSDLCQLLQEVLDLENR